MTDRRLYHITTSVEAEAGHVAGNYAPAAYQGDGFIHCSYRHQLIATANRIFRGNADLVVLEIDRNKLDVKVIDENLEGGTELFPHVYGRLPAEAIVGVHSLSADSRGLFNLPGSIGG